MNKHPLYVFVIAVAVVWTVILGTVWSLGDTARLRTFASVGGGFAIGMLTMYIAVHLYTWK